MKFALSTKLKHGHIYAYMKEHNLTATELARQIGIDQSTLGKYLNLKSVPGKAWQSKAAIKKLCSFFNCLPEDLFPEELRAAIQNKGKQAETLGKEQVIYFERDILYLGDVPPDLLIYEEPEIENYGLSEAINEALDTLTGQEKEVLLMRNQEFTLEEIAKNFGVTRERIRQVEAKALRKLRHPSRSSKLLEY